MSDKTVIIGAGPSGLAAAHRLIKKGVQVTVVEQEDYVGGLCRTFDYRGYKFDFGGNRFFTKQPEVDSFWRSFLGSDFLVRDRLSRIYYQKKFFAYPIKLGDAFKNLGLWESFLTGLSLIWIRLKRLVSRGQEITYEDWVVNRFGRRLFNHFFKSYTEKLWGVSVKELGADWAAQRMKDLSLWQVLKTFIVNPEQGQIKSLIEKFDYPKYGPGMLYDKIAESLGAAGVEIMLNSEVIKICHDDRRVTKIIVRTPDGAAKEIIGDNYISSMPLNILLRRLDPLPPEEIMKLVEKMRFRAFFDVCLIVKQKNVFPDNWIYVHEPDVTLLRVQNFKNWSPFTSPDPDTTNIGAEYVCWENDKLWKMNDDELVKLATKELEQVGLIRPGTVESGVVVRNRFAYPVYHLDYKSDMAKIFSYLSQFDNFQTIGRSGLYRYNNMDHSILTGFYAAENIFGAKHDLLKINADEEYHETTKQN